MSHSIYNLVRRRPPLSEPIHPLSRALKKIEAAFAKAVPEISIFTHLNPITSVRQNFDDLLISQDHPSRSIHDSYYVDKSFLFRTHLTPSELELFDNNVDTFLISGQVFRRDEIDSTHFPVFHQLEGVRTIPPNYKGQGTSGSDELIASLSYQPCHDQRLARLALSDLVASLDAVVKDVLGGNLETRWQKCSFPFTFPSIELEVMYRGKWIEVLGSGLLRDEIVAHRLGATKSISWAFGMGLERLAMILYDISDIRLFWSDDERFLAQFAHDVPGMKFSPFSNHPAAYRDVSVWIGDGFNSNDFFELVRSCDKGLIESVKEIDRFVHATGKQSRTFRLTYRSHERALSAKEIDSVHLAIRKMCSGAQGIELR